MSLLPPAGDRQSLRFGAKWVFAGGIPGLSRQVEIGQTSFAELWDLLLPFSPLILPPCPPPAPLTPLLPPASLLPPGPPPAPSPSCSQPPSASCSYVRCAVTCSPTELYPAPLCEVFPAQGKGPEAEMRLSQWIRRRKGIKLQALPRMGCVCVCRSWSGKRQTCLPAPSLGPWSVRPCCEGGWFI